MTDINVGAISEALNNKVDLNQMNTNTQGLSYASGWGMPSNRYIDLTLGASGTNYIAPANGWFWFLGSWTNQNAYFQLICRETEIRWQVPNMTIPSGYWSFPLFVKKGQTVATYYGVTPSNVRFRFYYAEGEQ